MLPAARPDAQIAANADRLIAALKAALPRCQDADDRHPRPRRELRRRPPEQVDTLLGTIAAKQGIPFVSVGDWLTKYNLTQLLADAVHMNAEGRTALGDLLGTPCGNWDFARTIAATAAESAHRTPLSTETAANRRSRCHPSGGHRLPALHCTTTAALRPLPAAASASRRGWR